MTIETSRRLVVVALWASVAANVASGVLAVMTAHYGQARVGLAILAVVLIVVWGIGRVDAWGAAVLREAIAKASFAERLFEKLQQTEGMGVQMEFGIEKREGTKH